MHYNLYTLQRMADEMLREARRESAEARLARSLQLAPAEPRRPLLRRALVMATGVLIALGLVIAGG
jgi:hypothetical protein